MVDPLGAALLGGEGVDSRLANQRILRLEESLASTRSSVADLIRDASATTEMVRLNREEAERTSTRLSGVTAVTEGLLTKVGTLGLETGNSLASLVKDVSEGKDSAVQMRSDITEEFNSIRIWKAEAVAQLARLQEGAERAAKSRGDLRRRSTELEETVQEAARRAEVLSRQVQNLATSSVGSARPDPVDHGVLTRVAALEGMVPDNLQEALREGAWAAQTTHDLLDRVTRMEGSIRALSETQETRSQEWEADLSLYGERGLQQGELILQLQVSVNTLTGRLEAVEQSNRTLVESVRALQQVLLHLQAGASRSETSGRGASHQGGSSWSSHSSGDGHHSGDGPHVYMVADAPEETVYSPVAGAGPRNGELSSGEVSISPLSPSPAARTEPRTRRSASNSGTEREGSHPVSDSGYAPVPAAEAPIRARSVTVPRGPSNRDPSVEPLESRTQYESRGRRAETEARRDHRSPPRSPSINRERSRHRSSDSSRHSRRRERRAHEGSRQREASRGSLGRSKLNQCFLSDSGSPGSSRSRSRSGSRSPTPRRSATERSSSRRDRSDSRRSTRSERSRQPESRRGSRSEVEDRPRRRSPDRSDRSRSHSRSSKPAHVSRVDHSSVPLYNGLTDVNQWIYRVELAVSQSGRSLDECTGTSAVRVVPDSEAGVWYTNLRSWTGMSATEMTWRQLKKLLLKRFGHLGGDDVLRSNWAATHCRPAAGANFISLLDVQKHCDMFWNRLQILQERAECPPSQAEIARTYVSGFSANPEWTRKLAKVATERGGWNEVTLEVLVRRARELAKHEGKVKELSSSHSVAVAAARDPPMVLLAEHPASAAVSKAPPLPASKGAGVTKWGGCFNCNQEGHVSRECPEAAAKCGRCGRPHHTAQHDPVVKQQRAASARRVQAEQEKAGNEKGKEKEKAPAKPKEAASSSSAPAAK